MSNLLTEEIRTLLQKRAVEGAELLVGTCCFPEGFAGFDGHFPGAPILPAVVQLLLAQELVRSFQGVEFQVGSISAAKFKRPIRPLEELEIRCRPRPEDNSFRTEIRVGGEVASSFCLYPIQEQKR